MRRRQPWIVLAALAAAFAASAEPVPASVTMDSFLAVPYEERLGNALSAEDHRYLAVAGAALEAPGAPPYWIERGRHRIIPGSLEALSAGANGALAERALAYARAYNERLSAALERASP